MEAEQANVAPVGSIAGSLSGGAFNQAMRKKFWDEMNDAQRMEKMREEVRYLRRLYTDLQRTVNKLKLHQHAQDGSIFVPLKRNDEDGPRGYFFDPLA